MADSRKKRYGTGTATPGDAQTKAAPRVGSGSGEGQAYNKVPKSDSGNTYTTKGAKG